MTKNTDVIELIQESYYADNNGIATNSGGGREIDMVSRGVISYHFKCPDSISNYET